MCRTKIVCTIGPASEEVSLLKELIRNGMNVARLNFSHGTHEEHLRRIHNIRQASQETGIPVAIMLDTKGPEIRIGVFKDGRVTLKSGQKVIITTQNVEGTVERFSVNYPYLHQDVKRGYKILIDDGLIALKIEEVDGQEIHCIVENGGELYSRKGVNVPGVEINLPSVAEADISDITLGVKEGLDFIAASFVRSAVDVLAIRKIIEDLGADLSIIAKIENEQGVLNADEIIKVSNGIMVARGDLGVEIPAEEVPLVQKKLIEKCNLAGKPVITATQMLDSMVRNPRPTRAEASDVANAILDGSDAIMLSGETAAGSYPVEAVKTMVRIANKTEEALSWRDLIRKRASSVGRTTTEAISHATCETALSLGATAVITATKTGSTAHMVSKYRPQAPIIAVTPDEKIARKLLLVWGVYPLIATQSVTTDVLIETAVETALQAGYIKNGDLVVITAGVPAGIPGTTNLLKVHTVGQVVAKGNGIGFSSVSGRVVVAGNAEEALKRIQEGDILVTSRTDRDYVPAIERAGGLITEEGGLTSHGAIVGLNLEKPVIVGVEDATVRLETGEIITIDPVRGLIYSGYAKAL